jgi:hypothetical protein
MFCAHGLYPQESGAPQVAEMAICTAVENRTPVGSGTTFTAEGGELFCFTRIAGAGRPTAVTHVWYFGDREMFRLELDVQSVNWRTWSSKKIIPSWTGAWKVEVLDAAGKLLKSLDFEVGD